MAGDWIKMRTTLDTHPKVIELAQLLGIPELHVVGLLWKVWSWADSHSIDGNAIRVTNVTLDRFTSVTGFANALREVGWLDGVDGCLSFPKFSEHNGQTGKKRAETAERVAKHRNAKSVTSVTQKVLPEKRREEKRIEEENTEDSSTVAKPTVEPATVENTVLEFPCVGQRKTWALVESQIAAWRELYPSIDVLGECRKALAWVKANDRKTAQGMPKFLVRWLNKASDDSRLRGVPVSFNGKVQQNGKPWDGKSIIDPSVAKNLKLAAMVKEARDRGAGQAEIDELIDDFDKGLIAR